MNCVFDKSTLFEQCKGRAQLICDDDGLKHEKGLKKNSRRFISKMLLFF